MLEALLSLSPQQAELTLARALDAYLPNLQTVELGDLEKRVIAEAEEELPESHESADVAERLGDELAALMLPPEAEDAARQRLGHAGILEVEQHDLIGFDGMWDTVAFKDNVFLGVTQDEAVGAFRRATSIDTIFSGPYKPNVENYQAAAITVTPIAASGRIGAHLMILCAAKRGANVWITSAYRAFGDEVRTYRGMGPLHVLERFLRAYGVEFKCGPNGAPTKMARNVHLSSQDRMIDTRFNGPFVSGLTFNGIEDGSADVILAYVVDSRRYHAAMQRHNVFFNLE